jgi:2-enoate reductase
MTNNYEALFKPFMIGKVKVKNRICMAPMLPNGWLDETKNVTDETIAYYTERAKGGAGLIFVGASFPDANLEKANFNISPFSAPEHFVVQTKKLSDSIHKYGTKLFFQIQLGSGRTGFPAASPGSTPIAPSAIPNRWVPSMTCRELTIEEIERLIDEVVKGAILAKQAGCDGIDINGIKGGYLGDQFAIDAFNQRTDEYGGSLENKTRILTTIVRRIKEACGEEFAVTTRLGTKSHMRAPGVGHLPGTEYTEYGRDIEESLKIGHLLEEAGFDAILFGTGTYDSLYWLYPPLYMHEGTYIEEASILKKELSIPVICPGKLSAPDLAAKAVGEGLVDAVGLGRGLVADPHWANKLRAGKPEEIRPCIYCNNGCLARVLGGLNMQCAVNADLFEEANLNQKYQRVNTPKKVAIVGGGVAGLEAARVAALRGHFVTVYEAGEELGGLMIPAHIPDFKFRDKWLLDWMILQCNKLGVEIRLSRKLGAKEILTLEEDVIVLATGSTPRRIPIAGGKEILTASDVLLDLERAGNKVVLVGGGQVGVETAVWLKRKGRDVVLVEAMSDLMQAPVEPIAFPNLHMLQELLMDLKIPVYLNSRVTSFDGNQVTLETEEGQTTLPADSVVLSIGYEANDDLYWEIYPKTQKPVWLLGDAKVPGTIMMAIRDGNAIGALI